MRNSTRLAIEIAAVLVIGAGAFFIGRMFPYAGAPAPAGGPVAVSDTAPRPSPTREDVPPGTTVPGANDSVPQNVVKPGLVIPAGEGTDLKKRDFFMTAQNGTLTPDTIIVGQGDVVDISVYAADRDYTFVQPDYGMGFTVKKGDTKKVENQFTQTGKFTLYCPDCGGPAAGPRGYIIVVAHDAS